MGKIEKLVFVVTSITTYNNKIRRVIIIIIIHWKIFYEVDIKYSFVTLLVNIKCLRVILISFFLVTVCFDLKIFIK